MVTVTILTSDSWNDKHADNSLRATHQALQGVHSSPCVAEYTQQGTTATDHNTHTHTCLTALFSGLPGWAGTRKVKPIWLLLKQKTVSGSGISWDICKSAPRSRQITMPATHHSVFYRSDALPAAQPTASKHWRQTDHNIHEQLIIAFIPWISNTTEILPIMRNMAEIQCLLTTVHTHTHTPL